MLFVECVSTKRTTWLARSASSAQVYQEKNLSGSEEPPGAAAYQQSGRAQHQGRPVRPLVPLGERRLLGRKPAKIEGKAFTPETAVKGPILRSG